MPQHVVLDAVRETFGIHRICLVCELAIIVAMTDEIVRRMSNGVVQISYGDWPIRRFRQAVDYLPMPVHAGRQWGWFPHSAGIDRADTRDGVDQQLCEEAEAGRRHGCTRLVPFIAEEVKTKTVVLPRI